MGYLRVAVEVSSLRLLVGDVRARLRELPSDHFQTVCTSPPYWGQRAYKTTGQTWGGDPDCEHLWQERRYYTEQSSGGSSGESFAVAGADNARRLREARWREDGVCRRCGAWQGEFGAEPTIAMYVEHCLEIAREIRRVLRPDGLFFLNLGDTYAANRTRQVKESKWGHDANPGRRTIGDGLKPKDLCLVPFRVAIALQEDGWWVRNDIIWHKPSCKPESVKDRFTLDYEHILLFTRSSRYYFDMDAVREPHATPPKAQARQRNTRGKQSYAGAAVGQPQQDSYAGLGFSAGGRNRRSVWSIPTKPYPGAHFATFPERLPEICLRAGTSEGGCCSRCGTPRERVTIKGPPDREWQAACGADAAGEYDGQATKEYASANAENASEVKRRILEGMRPKLTLGWRFPCSCWGVLRAQFPEARSGRKRQQRAASGDWRRRVGCHLNAHSPLAVAPCRVLDPFAGSGTTLAVAHTLGLDAIGIDLQPDYADLAVQRVAKAGGTLDVVRPEPVEIRDLLRAAKLIPAAVLEREWEGEPATEEGSGWVEDEVFEGFWWKKGESDEEIRAGGTVDAGVAAVGL